MEFYLGIHQPNWLADAGVPTFVSARRLRGRRSFPRAAAPWVLDSGGFTELSQPPHRWETSPRQYAREIETWSSEIGLLEWAAPQDSMCEPFILEKTGLSIREHQERTVRNYLELVSLAAPVVPVLQGWEIDDYLRCVDLYFDYGVYLDELAIVGLGTVCRRQNTAEAARIVRRLADEGIRLHGFGFKTTGIVSCGDALASADSMAWSYDARRGTPLRGCTHKTCANCLRYALRWRSDLLARMGQLRLEVA